MKDLVPKGTGNSRFLRSSIPANITHEELVALLRAGTFPVDFAGLNSAGVAVVGSAYNKANVLPDDVCTALGIATSAEPKDAFMAIKSNFNTIKNRIVTGTYTGNGIVSKDDSSYQIVNLGFKPACVFVYGTNPPNVSMEGIFIGFCYKEFPLASNYWGLKENIKIIDNGFIVRSTNDYAVNANGGTFVYIAIKEV